MGGYARRVIVVKRKSGDEKERLGRKKVGLWRFMPALVIYSNNH